jgi:hypothetical protein
MLMRSKGALMIIAAASIMSVMFSLGCARPSAEREIVTVGNSRRVTDRAVIVLPSTCVVETEISPRHFSSNRRPRTTMAVRRVLDHALVGSSLANTERATTETCDRDQGHHETETTQAAALDSLRASRAALDEMRSRGASHLLVIELRAELGCVSGAGAALVAHYGSVGIGVLSSEMTANRCQEDDITLTAYLFESDGRARWIARRNIDPATDNVEPLIDHFLTQIPVTLPGHRVPGTVEVRPCHLDNRNHADCT